MKTILENDKGISDLKSLSYVPTGVNANSGSVVVRMHRRTIVGVIVAVLLIACAQYVALNIIFATQPVRVTKGK